MNIFDLIKTTREKQFLSKTKEWLESNSGRINAEQSDISMGEHGGMVVRMTLSLPLEGEAFQIGTALDYLRKHNSSFNIKYDNCLMRNMEIVAIIYKQENPYVSFWGDQRGTMVSRSEVTCILTLETNALGQSRQQSSTTIDITRPERIITSEYRNRRRAW